MDLADMDRDGGDDYVTAGNFSVTGQDHEWMLSTIASE
jgi:hypothetical protein